MPGTSASWRRPSRRPAISRCCRTPAVISRKLGTMNDVASEPAPIAVREQGWWRVVFATLLFLFVLATPVIRIVLPIDQLLVLLAPALAACAVAGWWAGGRLPTALALIAVAGLVLVMFTSSG